VGCALRVRMRVQELKTALFVAANNGHLDVVKYLAEKAPETISLPDSVCMSYRLALCLRKSAFLEDRSYLF
jgi:ankyrin repeat protein